MVLLCKTTKCPHWIIVRMFCCSFKTGMGGTQLVFQNEDSNSFRHSMQVICCFIAFCKSDLIHIFPTALLLLQILEWERGEDSAYIIWLSFQYLACWFHTALVFIVIPWPVRTKSIVCFKKRSSGAYSQLLNHAEPIPSTWAFEVQGWIPLELTPDFFCQPSTRSTLQTKAQKFLEEVYQNLLCETLLNRLHQGEISFSQKGACGSSFLPGNICRDLLFR